MKHFDYIIVGCGLAGIAFCEKLQAHGKTFVVFDNNSQQSSLVAAGLYNPVVLKRFSKVWKAQEQLDLALPQYERIESRLNLRFDYRIPVLRRFNSVEEQNKWLIASDTPGLTNFMSPHFITNAYNKVYAPFGYGEVLSTGRLDTKYFIKSYKEYLRKADLLIEDKFAFEAINFGSTSVQYQDISAKYIVCCEGFGVKQNPYFKDLPINGTKGEVLTLRIPELNLSKVIKSSVFIIPIGEDLYKVGSTYNREDKTNVPTAEGQKELLTKLGRFISSDFEVVNHLAGIRPTVKDRRPVVGAHHKYRQLLILNGLGSRGVMIAPYVAEQLFDFVELKSELDQEITVDRFY